MQYMAEYSSAGGRLPFFRWPILPSVVEDDDDDSLMACCDGERKIPPRRRWWRTETGRERWAPANRHTHTSVNQANFDKQKVNQMLVHTKVVTDGRVAANECIRTDEVHSAAHPFPERESERQPLHQQ